MSAPNEPTDYEFRTAAVPGAQYNWYVNNVLYETVPDNVWRYYFPCRRTSTISCSITTCAGTTARSNSISKTGGCERTLAYTYGPNPAATELTVNGPEGAMGTLETKAETFEAQLYNSFGKLVKTGRSEHGKVRLDIQSLPNGLYTLRTGTGDEAVSEHIQILH
ncbi:T9SS type A sorting domain-containing protein [Hymenobacter cellulosilyticus]|uniref:T9SS type A sorting domain-containing protein n=1 Tax=Hymenobacter cellulosilyticus TaxID=2932248 RepID=UPI0035CB62D5